MMFSYRSYEEKEYGSDSVRIKEVDKNPHYWSGWGFGECENGVITV